MIICAPLIYKMIENSNSGELKIKLLESFSLPTELQKATSESFQEFNGILIKISLEMLIVFFIFISLSLDEHCDHSYSIISSSAYKQAQHGLLGDSVISYMAQLRPSPSVIQTGEFTMKIMNSIPITVVGNEINPEKLKYRELTAKITTTNECEFPDKLKDNTSILHTRTRSKPGVVHVIEPTDTCVTCHQDLFCSLKSSVFCLKTGNVLISCSKCATRMSLKGAFKLPKFIS